MSLNHDVEIHVGEHVYVLRPTLAAMDRIDGHFGGYQKAIVALMDLSFSAAVVIIAAGAGLDAKGSTELRERILKNGAIRTLGSGLATYLGNLYDPPWVADSGKGQSSGE